MERIKKNSNKKGKNDKFQKDNRNIYNYINNSFIINQNQKENYKVNALKRISSFHEKSISKNGFIRK